MFVTMKGGSFILTLFSNIVLVLCQSDNVAFTLGQTNHLYLAMENSYLIIRSSQTCQLTLILRALSFAENQGCLPFISFLWLTHKVKYGSNFTKIQITCVLFMVTRHMVMPTRVTL